DQPVHDLGDARKALQQAVQLDENSPAALIELGYYLDNVEDDSQAASKAFSQGIAVARRLLIDALLGRTKALLQLKKRDEALKCLIEALHLANAEESSLGTNRSSKKRTDAGPDILLRDSSGRIRAVAMKGPYAIKVEDLLQEFFPKRSA